MSEEQEEKKEVKNSRFTIFVIASFIIINCAFWLFVGYFLGAGSLGNIKYTLTGKEPPVRYQSLDFGKYWEALAKLEDSYIGEIDYQEVLDNSILGMTLSVGDPFTAYLDKETLDLFNSEIGGTFEGIGAEISIRNGDLVIVAPIKGSPAEVVGLKSGDIIKEVDGVSVLGMTTEEAVTRMRGKKNTYVVVKIERGKGGEIIDFKIRRDVINVKSVDYKMIDDKVGYIRILRFDESTKSLFSEASRSIVSKKASGMILDLRNNPGGYLTSAIDIASEFIKEGVIVIEEYKDGENDKLYATGKGKMYNIPLVVLVNGGSASGSEIVAGAIQDSGRGILIGEKTFGKGSVQEIQSLAQGGALKITIAKWLTPKGRVIDKNGLEPDIEVKYEEDGNFEFDNQMERAKEEIVKIIK